MKKTIWLCLALVLIALTFSCKSAETVWYTDYTEASELATTENKDLLIAFTGTTFDGVSDTFISEILQSKDFMKTAGKHFVLLNLELINSTEGLSDEEIEKYQEPVSLAYQFGVQSVPAIFALTPTSSVFASINYENQEKNDFVALIKELAKKGAKISKTTAKIEKSNGLNKAKEIAKLYEVVTDDYLGLVIPYVDDFLANDTENKTGKMGAFLRMKALTDSSVLAQTGDIEGAIKLFIDLTTSEYSSTEDVQFGFYYAAYFASYGGQYFSDEALSYLQQAADTDPTTEVGQYSQSILDQYNAYASMYSDYSLDEDFDEYDTEEVTE